MSSALLRMRTGWLVPNSVSLMMKMIARSLYGYPELMKLMLIDDFIWKSLKILFFIIIFNYNI
jgi:hypothetical protein